MGRSGVLGILLVAACGGAREVSNLDELRSGELVVSGAQEDCLNGKSNQFSVFSSARAIKDQYLAVMYPGVAAETALGLVAKHQGTVLFVPPAPVNAFAVHMEEAQARALATEPGVCVVFQDYFYIG
jgi:hypothetical protein